MLVNLLNRAKKFLQHGAAAAPARSQYYHVSCPEGHRLSGARTEGYQALRCPTCGEGIFILPRSPLPDPPVPSSEPRRTRPVASEVVLSNDEPIGLSDPPPMTEVPVADEPMEIQWVDQPDQASTPEQPADTRVSDQVDDAWIDEELAQLPRPDTQPAVSEPRAPAARRPSPPSPTRPASRARPTAELAATATVAAAPEPAHEPFDLREWAQRHRNPLIFAGVALLVLSAVAYRIRLNARENLPAIAKAGLEQGLPALDEGRFDTAHQLLSKAKRAVEALHDQVEGAADIRQGADEAAIITSLISESLETILGEAFAAPDREAWSNSQFPTYYKGRSIIIDATVAAVPGGHDSKGYDVDYRIFPNGPAFGERPRSVGRIDFTGFKLFEERLKPTVGDRVRFGARIASFRYDSDSEMWLVGVEPDSGIQMLHTKALEALNWPSEEPKTAEDRP